MKGIMNMIKTFKNTLPPEKRKELKKILEEFERRLEETNNEVEIILLKEIYEWKISKLIPKTIPQYYQSISDIKENISIVDIFNQFFPNVELRKSSNKFYCLCPFHQETSPSFYLYPETNSFYCFGCQVGGDVIELIKKVKNWSYKQVIKFLTRG